MEIFYGMEKKAWDAFIASASSPRKTAGAEFLQSWQWGETLKAEGEEILRVGIRKKGKADYSSVCLAATLIKKSLGAGYFYWYAPRGPIGARAGQIAGDRVITDKEAAEFFLAAVKKIDRRALFLRLEPKDNPAARARGMIKETAAIQPKKTLLLDLTADEEELLAAMHQKTRYNLRLAEKKGVKIKRGSAADFREFWRLMNLTGERGAFRLHGAAHYKNLLNADKDFIKLFFAEYQGKNIAAGLFCFWKDKVTYLHGASDNEFRNVMAPYLLQWSVIKDARENGYRYYDFYGIDEKRWPGVTRFKQGFGGREVNYPGTFDAVYRPVLYYLYNFIRMISRGVKKFWRK
jgi:lipid II:glycine glycyltransferase (peptidoglycan interpeptide bridge formation enzyme)